MAVTGKWPTVAMMTCVLLLASCSDGSRVTSDAPLAVTQAPIGASCTRDAQVSIFRPRDFTAIANRSTIVVLARDRRATDSTRCR